jgi:acyl carrier protein
VIVREDEPGEKRLVAYIVAAREQAVSGAELRKYLGEKLPEYMAPAVYVELKELPMLPNGKLDRKALPAPTTSSEAGRSEGPRTPVEEILAGILAEVLGLEEVGVEENFFALGGHSLLATQVASRVRESLQVELPLREFFESPTVASMAEAVERELGAGRGVEAPPIKPVGRESELPLSFAQQRLWFIQQLEPESAAYNIPIVMRVKGEIQTQCMWQSLGEIERRHEALRTRFEERNGRPVQLIDEAREVEAWTCDLSGVTEEAREECARDIAEREWRRPFALDGERLWRSGMIRLGEEEQVLVMCMHHVVSDGWSTGVMIREFSRIYESYVSGRQSPLEELEVQYADYAVWQREWLQGEALEEHLKYWRRQLAMAPVLRFRTDQEQPPGMTGQLAAKAPFIIPVELTEAVKRLSRSEGVTLFMTLLAVYQITLGRYRHQEDVVVGTGVAGRNRMEVEGLIGFFINQLALRVRLEDRLTFRELLGRIREVTLGAYAHQDLPYEKLVEALAPKRDLIGAPLFEASLILQNMPQEQVDLPMFRLSPFPEGPQIAKYPLELIVEESPDQLIGALRYATNALYHTDAELLVAQLKELLSIVTIQPDLSLSSLKAKLDEFDSKYRAARRDSIKGVIERRLSGRRHPSSMST